MERWVRAAQNGDDEAFVEAYRRLPQLTHAAAFPAWFHRIVLGKCVRMLRGGKSVIAALPMEELLAAPSPKPGPESLVMEADTREVLREAMRVLSDEERRALLLYAVGGYRYGEIAQVMSLSLALVKKRLYTARQRLRTQEEWEHLRPSHKPGFARRVQQQAVRRHRMREEYIVESPVRVQNVELLGPGREYKQTIKNLYSFYRYDLMPQFDAEPLPAEEVTEETWQSGAWVNQWGVLNGLTSKTHEEGVTGEDVFWEWPNLRAYLIRLNGWPAGIAMVASPPNATPGVDYRLQEFFVINKARRRGVGTEAARLLFDRLPGKWELAYDPKSPSGPSFWRKFVPAYTEGDYPEEMIGMGSMEDMPGYIFTNGV